MTSMTRSGIAYDDRGFGEPTLLFLPGWAGPRTLFEPLVDRLDGRFRTLAVDWRGHGDSRPADADFGASDLVDDAIAVIDDANAGTVVPVAVAHAGWIAIELRRRIGPDRVSRLAFVDWMVLGAPAPFLDALAAMASPDTTRAVVDEVTSSWVGNLQIPALSAYVASMAANPDVLWARGAREIATDFRRYGAPVNALAALTPPPPALHLYAQPADPAYLGRQKEFAAAHPWFAVEHLEAASHFPMFEVPDAIAAHLTSFAST